jgi:hypothetical protein
VLLGRKFASFDGILLLAAVRGRARLSKEQSKIISSSENKQKIRVFPQTPQRQVKQGKTTSKGNEIEVFRNLGKLREDRKKEGPYSLKNIKRKS